MTILDSGADSTWITEIASMDFSEISNRGGTWRKAPRSNNDTVRKLRDEGPVGLPDRYFEFLRFSDGGEGDLGVEPGWFAPWASTEVIQLNGDYQIAACLPSFFGFGSKGGGEMSPSIVADRRPGRLLRYPSFL
jgi:hypothetical protein